MIEVFGDLWDYPADVICLTTNGYTRKDGAAVMGRGVAFQAKKRYPGIEFELGKKLQTVGNHVYLIQSSSSQPIMAFPVKHNWWEKADLELIAHSAEELKFFASPPVIGQPLTFVLPRPGCGNGQLDWADVKPLLLGLPDNVHVITDQVEAK